MVHTLLPPASRSQFQNTPSRVTCTQWSHLNICVFLLFVLLYLRRGGMIVTAVVSVAGGSPLVPCLGFTDATELSWIFRHQYVHTQRVELCVPGLLGGDSKPSDPNTAPQQPSTHKLLLIKPAGLIMGCSIKYVSRCFRCSLRVLVKAGEASDQGCWPCKHSAHPPLAWMPGCACLQVLHNLALLICSVACRKHRA